ncbi:MAG: ankyrin repeat domain-containing protein [Anaerolineaceae bacterium]|nr:ankyrin repeat domain-containing protein [Anaerolineaceae bacterium]
MPECIGTTPLIAAIMSNNFLLVRMLLKAGANPNTLAFKDEEPTNALDAAYDDYCAQETKAETMNLDAIVELLKEYGAKTSR